MDIILCHQTADFDALGAAVGLTLLKKGAKVVLPGGSHPSVRDFLVLHRDEFNLMEMRSVKPEIVRSLTIVDTQNSSRLGKAAQWLTLPNIKSIEVYDHHLHSSCDIPATQKYIEAVGATTTLVVECLQQQQLQPTAFEATVMALGIHVDTGSLTFEQTTPRDAYALGWLLQKGAHLPTISQYVEPSLSPQLQQLLTQAMENVQKEDCYDYHLGIILVETEEFIPGLSSLVEKLIEITELDVLLFAHQYTRNRQARLSIIGRSRINGTNLQEIFSKYGGGGHSQAASLALHGVNAQQVLQEITQELRQQIPPPLTARDLMSSPVRTIRPEVTIAQAQRILLRYGHSGLSVVDQYDRLVGIISRRDLDLAIHHGFEHAPVKGYMTRNPKTITPETALPQIENLMMTYDIGRLPVVENGHLVGMVTRTDILRQLHQNHTEAQRHKANISCLLPSIRDRLIPEVVEILRIAQAAAKARGWHLYLVGGAVRDLLLTTEGEQLLLQDIDLVVDSLEHTAEIGAGVELAQELQKIHPQAKLSIHGEFKTAALVWHKDPQLGSLWVDIATSRTEFYPYPAANPEVEASSIRQDLYRRDFTINALAIRLTPPRGGELLDFFGGLMDLRERIIRVLHANSFIEDPTRIYRAVRFCTRLGFEMESQTQEYIRYAIATGIYERLHLQNKLAPALTTRLRAELKYILEATYAYKALQLLSELGALSCIDPHLKLDKSLWWQIRYLCRWLKIMNKHSSQWLTQLELLLTATPEAVKVAQRLDLPKDSVVRLEQLPLVVLQIEDGLSNCVKSSDIVKLLKAYKIDLLLLVACKVSKSNRRRIWEYIHYLSKVTPILNGDDLKGMGYKPGPQFKILLDELLRATLDGEVTDRSSARELLQKLG